MHVVVELEVEVGIGIGIGLLDGKIYHAEEERVEEEEGGILAVLVAPSFSPFSMRRLCFRRQSSALIG